MSEWIYNPKQNPPPEGVMVFIRGTDLMGAWFSMAMRKDYKPGSTKQQLRRVWRWCYEDGTRFDDQAVDAYRIPETQP